MQALVFCAAISLATCWHAESCFSLGLCEALVQLLLGPRGGWSCGGRPPNDRQRTLRMFTRAHTVAKVCVLKEKKNRIKNQFNKYILFFVEATRARERSPIGKKLWLSIHLGSHLTVLPSVQPHHRVTTLSSLCGRLQPKIAHPYCGQLTAV